MGAHHVQYVATFSVELVRVDARLIRLRHDHSFAMIQEFSSSRAQLLVYAFAMRLLNFDILKLRGPHSKSGDDDAQQP